MTTTPTPAEQIAHFHDLLTKFHTAMLITHGQEGNLGIRPMALAHVEDDCRVWFFTGASTSKAQEIENDSRVYLVCQDDKSAYLALSGLAELSTDPAKIDEVWKEPFRVWFPGGKEDPQLKLIMIQPTMGEYWDNGGIRKIEFLFDTLKAYVTGTTPKIQEGEQHGVVRLSS